MIFRWRARPLASAILGLAVGVVFAVPALAGELVNTSGRDVAILGYDPVAYFTEGRPVEGKPDFEHVWHDARWRFSSRKHRDMFASEPGRYAPRYGGFCAGAMAKGLKASVDPEAWVIIDGKLYLNYAKRFAKEFMQDSTENIAKADANWQRLGRVE